MSSIRNLSLAVCLGSESLAYFTKLSHPFGCKQSTNAPVPRVLIMESPTSSQVSESSRLVEIVCRVALRWRGYQPVTSVAIRGHTTLFCRWGDGSVIATGTWICVG